MFICGGIGGVWSTVWKISFFYGGYGWAEIDSDSLAYYRFERIIQDIAVISEEIFAARKNRADLALWDGFVSSNFLPGGMIEIAYNSGKIMGQYKVPEQSGVQLLDFI